MKKIISFVSISFGSLFILTGLDKFFHFLPLPREMSHVQYEAFYSSEELGWLLPLVGIVEILAGTLFIFSKTRPVGTLTILPIIVGILILNLWLMSNVIYLAALLTFINILFLILNYSKYRALFKE